MRKCANGLSSGLSSGPVKWPICGPVRDKSGGQVVSLFVRITSILADQALSSGDITTALGKEYYSGHLRRIIKMLLSDGIIEYTIPEKPRSRLQKYRLTEKGRQMLAQKGTRKWMEKTST